VDRRSAIASLAPLYANALHLLDEGLSRLAIADRLGLDVDQVEPILRIAQAKLDRIMGDNADQHRQAGRADQEE
jgi:hypothetical protein